jgi:hypothetical protein
MDVTLPQGTTYILVVDTDAYAGNFERQLAGYATGVVDVERRHGIEEAADAEEAAPEMVRALRAKSLAVRHDQFGMVTNTIRATPGRRNNGSGFHYTPGDPEVEEDARARAKRSAIDFFERAHADVRRRLAENDFQPEGPGAWTREACERTLASAQASIDRAGQFIGWPAYESVAMFFSEPLTEREMAFVRERSEEFAKTPRLLSKPFRVLDVRLVESTSTTEESDGGH